MPAEGVCWLEAPFCRRIRTLFGQLGVDMTWTVGFVDY